MNVLLHSKAFYPSVGGLEAVSRLLAANLRKRGVQVKVLSDTPLGESRELDGYPVVRRAGKAEKRRLVREADLVHSNGFSLELLPLCLRYRRPIVWTHTGHQGGCLTGDGRHQGIPCGHQWRRCFPLTCKERGLQFAAWHTVKLLFHRVALRLAARNVCITGWVAQNLAPPRSVVIWNPVDIQATRNLPAVPSSGRLMFFGRLVTQKGVDTLLKALSICHDRGRSYALDVYGDGPERGRLEALGQDLGISGAVQFHGTVPDSQLAEALVAAWIVIVPSRYEEGMGLVAVEAMAAGKPLIVSRHGGLAEVSRGCALTVENGDEQQLAEQIILLAEDDGLRHSLAQAGPAQAELFDPEQVADRYLAVYREIVAGGQRSHLPCRNGVNENEA